MWSKVVKLIIFNFFAHEILSVDTVWTWQSFTYEELKDIFKENKHGFDCKRHTLTYFVAFEEHNYGQQSDIKCLAKLSRSLLLMALYSLQFSAFMYKRRINYDSATVNISVFIQLRKHFILEWCFPKNHELGSLVLLWEKLKKCETHGRIERIVS